MSLESKLGKTECIWRLGLVRLNEFGEYAR